MSEDLRIPTKPDFAGGFAGTLATLTLPGAAFAASVLCDVLSLLAETPEQAGSYRRGAATMLELALSGSLATIGLELVDALRAPDHAKPHAARTIALDGAAIAVYLLDIAARQERLHEIRPFRSGLDAAPIGWSLLGLGLLAISGKLK